MTGYEPKSIEVESMSGSKIQSVVVLYEGPPCDEILNYTIKMRFSCGPHLVCIISLSLVNGFTNQLIL